MKRAALITGLVLGLGHRAAQASIVTVTSLGDGAANPMNCPSASGCRLRDALAKATSGDTITFAGGGTIVLTNGELAIARSLTIAGPGANALVVSANQASRVFRVASGVTVAIRELTIANGKESSGGGIHNMAHLTLTNVALTGNVATMMGAGMYNIGNLTITGSTFSVN
jgi:hypothetical protein